MDAALSESVVRIFENLLLLSARDPRLREDLVRISKHIIQRLDEPSEVPTETEAVAEPDDTAIVEQAVSAAEEAPAPMKPSVGELLPALTLGRSVEPSEEPVRYEETPAAEPVDLAAVEKRCRVKAEASRWAATRRQRLEAGASYELEIEPKDREVIQKGKEAETFLWMSHPSGPSPSDPTRMEDLANCFEVLAEAISLIRSVSNELGENTGEFEEALNLLAEAQCMTRTAVSAAEWDEDKDQQALHGWLRGTTYRLQIYVSNFMKVTDTADPSDWPDLSNRIDALDSRLESRRAAHKKRRNLFGKIRYHANRLTRGDGVDRDATQIIEAASDLVRDGLPPSSAELREILLPTVEQLPDISMPPEFSLILREIDRYLASQTEKPESSSDRERNEDIAQVAKLLKGRKVTIVGGQRRPAAQRAIQQAFDLKEVNWVRSDEHESVSTFEPAVADPEVCLVILMIRWSSHSYADLQQYCDKYSKPLLRLPGGYNPNQIAHQVLQQCSDRLR